MKRYYIMILTCVISLFVLGGQSFGQDREGVDFLKSTFGINQQDIERYLQNIQVRDETQYQYLMEIKRSDPERFELMVRLIADTQGSVLRVLDLGCGTGSLMLRVLEEFLDARVCGIDYDPTPSGAWGEEVD